MTQAFSFWNIIRGTFTPIVVVLGFPLLLWLDVVSALLYAAEPIDEGQLQSVDDKTTATLSAFRYNRATRTYFGSVTVKNTSAVALPKTMYLVVNAITPDSINIVNLDGKNSSGKPYYDVSPFIEGDTLPAGAITNPLIVEFTNPQRVQIHLDLRVYIVSVPIITSTPVTTAVEKVAYFYDVEAKDEDGDILTYALTIFPNGMSIDDATGEISWTPDASQAGSHDVTVNVSDSKDGIDTQSFTIVVAEAFNVLPVITSTPITTGEEGVAYIYDVEATDGDNDALTYSLTKSPVRMNIDSATGVIAWTPSDTQAGIHPVTVSVTDGRGEINEQNFTIEVAETLNESPMIIIIILLMVLLAVGTTIGIWSFLKKGVRQNDKENTTEISSAVEKLIEVMNQLEETPENGERKTENTEGEISSELKSHLIKEGAQKKAVNKVQDESKNETAIQKQELEKYLGDDEISALVGRLTRLADEYEETYQTLRRRIANKYKQLQETSEYIDSQAEKLNKLTSNDVIETEDEIQAGKHSPKYTEVHKLDEQGIDHVEIARRTELSVGEVDLLLSLSDSTKSKD